MAAEQTISTEKQRVRELLVRMNSDGHVELSVTIDFSNIYHRRVIVTDPNVDLADLLKRIVGRDTSLSDQSMDSGEITVGEGSERRVAGRWAGRWNCEGKWSDDINQVVIYLPSAGAESNHEVFDEDIYWGTEFKVDIVKP
jgi:hypothetical protein